jgi:secreted PhoX family phosphatase
LAQTVGLLDKQELVSSVSLKQSPQKQDLVQTIVAKQQLVELQKRLDQLHPADLAFVLEGLPLDRRERVWGLVRADRRGAVLLELSDAARDHLLGEMKENEIIGAAEHLDSDEIAFLAANLIGGTPCARPEDIEIHPVTKQVFITMTDGVAGSDGYPDSRLFALGKYSAAVNGTQPPIRRGIPALIIGRLHPE